MDTQEHYSLWGSLIQGRLIGLVKNVDNFNGHEAPRQLLANCQAHARNLTMSLSQGTMSHPKEHFNQYEKLEANCRRT